MYANMMVGISGRRVRARVFSVHAPTQAVRDEAVHDEFFSSLRAELSSVPVGWITFLNADFNAALGPLASAGIGASSPDKENDGGARVRELVAECGITLLNTFGEHASLTSWRSATGREHRIDYVGVSSWAAHFAVRAGVRKDVDMSFSVEVDHWPVQAAFEFSLEVAAKAPPSIRWDRDAMRDSQRASLFEEALKQRMPPPCGRLCEDAESLICTVREVGAEHFTLVKGGQRKAWISDYTFLLMRQAWQCKDVLRDARVWLRSVHLAPVFWSWRLAARLCGGEVAADCLQVVAEVRVHLPAERLEGEVTEPGGCAEG